MSELLEDRIPQLLKILRYQFNRYWQSAGNYDPTTTELLEIPASLFGIWLLNADDGLWDEDSTAVQNALGEDVTEADRDEFARLLDEWSSASRLCNVIELAWPIISVRSSHPAGIRVVATEVTAKIFAQLENGPVVESQLRVTATAEDLGEDILEPQLIYLWKLALRNLSRALLDELLSGLFSGPDFSSKESKMVPKPVDAVTRVPGESPFEFQPLTKVDQASHELAAEMKELFSKLSAAVTEIQALQRDIAVLKANAGLL